jgi:ubiquinone/menaquinone biosynthesis C-methylase UbiE
METFGSFEHHAWQKVGKAYDDFFGNLTTQSIEPLLDAAGISRGTQMLDIATGPGHVAAAAARRGARVTGLDFSSEMVALASSRYPDIGFREGNAEALPFADETFDAVVICFGLLHFPDADRALGEAFRVLRHGGRLGISVWATADKAVGFGIVLDAVQAHGNMDVGLPPGPSFFRFSDPQECRRALEAAGFADPRTVEIPQTWRFASVAAWIEGVERSTVRTAALLRAQTPEAYSTIRAAVEQRGRAYLKNDGRVELPMPAMLTAAKKP